MSPFLHQSCLLLKSLQWGFVLSEAKQTSSNDQIIKTSLIFFILIPRISFSSCQKSICGLRSPITQRSHIRIKRQGLTPPHDSNMTCLWSGSSSAAIIQQAGWKELALYSCASVMLMNSVKFHYLSPGGNFPDATDIEVKLFEHF